MVTWVANDNAVFLITRNPEIHFLSLLDIAQKTCFFTFSQRNYTHFLLQSHILNDLKDSEYFVNYEVVDFQFHLRRFDTVISKITVVSKSLIWFSDIQTGPLEVNNSS